jgi:ribosomal protein L21E
MDWRIYFVYALFDKSGVCQYVGQTLNPTRRKWMHLRKRFAGLTFKVLRETNQRNINRLENQIGSAYQRHGEASQSKVFNTDKIRKIRVLPDHVEDRKLWDWILGDRELAKIHGISRQTVNKDRRRFRIPSAWDRQNLARSA